LSNNNPINAMRFIKLNYENGFTVTLCLDDLVIMDSFDGFSVNVHVRNHANNYNFRKNPEEFFSAVFSDVDSKEYELVEIDEDEQGDETLFEADFDDL
jgi:hypothetical protein